MNARSWATEATSWYLSHLDPYASHQSNCRTHLRGPVVALTLRLLQTQTSSSNKQIVVKPEDPLDTLTFHQTDDAAYDRLTRRTKARLEAFLMGMELAAPPPVDSVVEDMEDNSNSSSNGDNNSNSEAAKGLDIGDGLAGFRKLSLSAASRLPHREQSGSVHSSGNANNNNNNTKHCPQMGAEEITTRMELYIRTLCRVQAQNQECVLAAEPIRALKARARSIVLALVETVGTVRQQAPVLTRLLTNLVRELLAVDVLGEASGKLIRQVVSRYEQQTSFASLAFLSSPDDSAGKLAAPMILDLLKYCQQHWPSLVNDAELERMLSLSIPPQLRRIFREMEFQSIGHLLEVCHEYRHALRHIELAPDQLQVAPSTTTTAATPKKTKSNVSATGNITESGGKPAAKAAASSSTSKSQRKQEEAAAVRQALRDLQREVLTVNGSILPPVTSRTELLNLLQQTLNSSSSFRVTRRTRRRHRLRASAAVGGSIPANHSDALTMTEGSDTTGDEGGYAYDDMDDEEDDDEEESADEKKRSSGKGESKKATTSNKSMLQPPPTIRKGSELPARRPIFHLSTVDFLTRRLLLAAGRTGTGGDAYFVVRDLFGGEDVAVVPSSSSSHHHSGKHSAAATARPLATTMEITTSSTHSITIAVHGTFDVYPSNMVGDCEPLIQLHTTTTEVIYLQTNQSTNGSSNGKDNGNGDSKTPLRPLEDGSSSSSSSNNNNTDNSNMGAKNQAAVLVERHTERSGWRLLEIRPALYEKVDEWNTPS